MKRSLTLALLSIGLAAGALSVTAVPAAAATNVSLPTISGTARVGETLTASRGGWRTGLKPTLYVTQWLRDGSPVSGANNQKFVLSAADLGSKFSVRITAIQEGSVSQATSKQTAAVLPGIITAGTPSVTGKVQIGQTLTPVPGNWQPPGVSFYYQWFVDGAWVHGCTDALNDPGDCKFAFSQPDTGQTFLLNNPTWVGKQVKVVVWGRKLGYVEKFRTAVAGFVKAQPAGQG
jgi:hypothetical protein